MENFAHDSLQALVQLQGDGRHARPAAHHQESTVPQLAQLERVLTSGLGFIRYPSPNSSIPIIKNEELILLRAEANINLNDLGTALTDINQIRTESGGLDAARARWAPRSRPSTSCSTTGSSPCCTRAGTAGSTSGATAGWRWSRPETSPEAARSGGPLPEVVHLTLPIPRDEVLAR